MSFVNLVEKFHKKFPVRNNLTYGEIKRLAEVSNEVRAWLKETELALGHAADTPAWYRDGGGPRGIGRPMRVVNTSVF